MFLEKFHGNCNTAHSSLLRLYIGNVGRKKNCLQTLCLNSAVVHEETERATNRSADDSFAGRTSSRFR